MACRPSALPTVITAPLREHWSTSCRWGIAWSWPLNTEGDAARACRVENTTKKTTLCFAATPLVRWFVMQRCDSKSYNRKTAQQTSRGIDRCGQQGFGGVFILSSSCFSSSLIPAWQPRCGGFQALTSYLWHQYPCQLIIGLSLYAKAEIYHRPICCIAGERSRFWGNRGCSENLLLFTAYGSCRSASVARALWC